MIFCAFGVSSGYAENDPKCDQGKRDKPFTVVMDLMGISTPDHCLERQVIQSLRRDRYMSSGIHDSDYRLEIQSTFGVTVNVIDGETFEGLKSETSSVYGSESSESVRTVSHQFAQQDMVDEKSLEIIRRKRLPSSDALERRLELPRIKGYNNLKGSDTEP